MIDLGGYGPSRRRDPELRLLRHRRADGPVAEVSAPGGQRHGAGVGGGSCPAGCRCLSRRVGGAGRSSARQPLVDAVDEVLPPCTVRAARRPTVTDVENLRQCSETSWLEVDHGHFVQSVLVEVWTVP